MDIQQVLKIPKGELAFNSPKDVPKDRHDWRYGTLRSDLGHRGLRYWQSFEEKPTYTQKLLKLPTGIPENWRPHIHLWDRFAASELSIADFYKKTLIQRVNMGLEAVCPGVHIVGTPRHFSSYGTYDNRIEGDAEKLVGPDLLVLDADCLDGDFIHPPSLQNLAQNIVTIGEFKQKNVEITDDDSVLPGTLGCYEAWLAQPIQCCLDLRISLGFLLTNVELVVFHLSKMDDCGSQMDNMTLRSKNLSNLDALPSDATQEPVFSSPVVRKKSHWVSFQDGDSDIPDVSKQDHIENQVATPTKHSHTMPESLRTPLHRTLLPSSPLAHRKRTRTSSFEVPNSSQASLQPPPTPSPGTREESDNASISDLPFSSQHGTVSPSEFEIDRRGEDPSHILIRSYQIRNNEEVGVRLFEHIMLAKRARRFGLLEMGHFKLSHSALDDLEAR